MTGDLHIIMRSDVNASGGRRETILRIVVLDSYRQTSSKFHTKAKLQCTNIFNGHFVMMHTLTLFSVGIVSSLWYLWGL